MTSEEKSFYQAGLGQLERLVIAHESRNAMLARLNELAEVEELRRQEMHQVLIKANETRGTIDGALGDLETWKEGIEKRLIGEMSTVNDAAMPPKEF